MELKINRPFLILVVVLLFVAVFLFNLLFLQKEKDQLADTNELILEKESTLERLNKTIEQKSTDTIKKQSFDYLMHSLPIWDNSEQIVIDFRSIEKKTNVTIDRITFNPQPGNRLSIYQSMQDSAENVAEETPFPSIQEVLVTLEMHGQYGQIRNFIQGVQELRRIMMIDSVSIHTGGNTPNAADNSSTATLQLTAYFDPSNIPYVDTEWLDFPLIISGD